MKQNHHWSLLEDENDWPSDQGSLKVLAISKLLEPYNESLDTGSDLRFKQYNMSMWFLFCNA